VRRQVVEVLGDYEFILLPDGTYWVDPVAGDQVTRTRGRRVRLECGHEHVQSAINARKREVAKTERGKLGSVYCPYCRA
jgi:hypothetical protein